MDSLQKSDEEHSPLLYASDEHNIMSLRLQSTDLTFNPYSSQSSHSPTLSSPKKIRTKSSSCSPTRSPTKTSKVTLDPSVRMAELVSETIETEESIRYQEKTEFVKFAGKTATNTISSNIAINITENTIMHTTDAVTQALISGTISGIIGIINLAISKDKKRALFTIVPSVGMSFIPGLGPVLGCAMSIAGSLAGGSVYDNFIAKRVTIVIELDQLIPKCADKRMSTLQRNLVKVLQYIREEQCPEHCECEVTEMIKELEQDFTETAESVVQEMISGIMSEKIEEAKKSDAIKKIIRQLTKFKEFLEKLDKLFARIHEKSAMLEELGSKESKPMRKYRIIFKEFNHLIKKMVEVSGESVLHLKAELDVLI